MFCWRFSMREALVDFATPETDGVGTESLEGDDELGDDVIVAVTGGGGKLVAGSGQ